MRGGASRESGSVLHLTVALGGGAPGLRLPPPPTVLQNPHCHLLCVCTASCLFERNRQKKGVPGKNKFGNPGLDRGPSGFLIHCHPTLGDAFGLPIKFSPPPDLPSRHKLHVMVDEVYMLSVFEESVGYHSVLSLER